MEKVNIILSILLVLFYDFSIINMNKVEGVETDSTNDSSVKMFDENGIYRNDFFGILIKLPKIKGKLVSRTGNNASVLKGLIERCTNSGNIIDKTNIEASYEYCSLHDIWMFSGGFSVVITTENQKGRDVQEIVHEKIKNFNENIVKEEGVDFGFFKYTIAGDEYNAGWIIFESKSNTICKIYARVKDDKALIIYIEQGDDGIYSYSENKYIVKNILKPQKYGDSYFYKNFLKLTDNPLEMGCYTVQEDDSLWKLAENFYNDGSKYTKIKKYNNLNKDVIYKDQILKIPVLE